MTSLQAAHRVARNLTETDVTRLSASALAEVQDALNAALQIAYSFLPVGQRQTTVSELLPAPVTVAVQVVAREGNLLLGAPFTSEQRGRTVTLCDDSHANEVVSANAVLDAFLGQSLSGSAIVYGDCVPLFQVVQEMTSAPRLYDGAGDFRGELQRDQQFQHHRWRREIGTPRTYALESVGSSQGTEPAYYLRVHPMPDRALRIRFDAVLATMRVTFAQMTQEAVNLPVPEHLCESALIPLAEAHLLTSQLWGNPAARAGIEKKKEEAMTLLRREPQDVGAGFNRIGTPRGF